MHTNHHLTTDEAASVQAGFVKPCPYQFRGNRVARGLLHMLGWQVLFEACTTSRRLDPTA